MTKDIIRKLANELGAGIVSEVQVVYMLAGIRKIIERDNLGKEYRALRFHCDWALHALMDREAAKDIVKQFDAAHDLLVANVELEDLPFDLRHEIEQVSQMKAFRKQLLVFLDAYNLPSLKGSGGWTRFLHLYTRVIEDIPLVLRRANQPHDAEQQHVSHVTVSCETAERLREDTFGRRHIIFKVTWNIFDTSGRCGEIFVINSFAVEDAAE
jgi:hypothetical protein